MNSSTVAKTIFLHFTSWRNNPGSEMQTEKVPVLTINSKQAKFAICLCMTLSCEWVLCVAPLFVFLDSSSKLTFQTAERLPGSRVWNENQDNRNFNDILPWTVLPQWYHAFRHACICCIPLTLPPHGSLNFCLSKCKGVLNSTFNLFLWFHLLQRMLFFKSLFTC